eukprot:TRINITY_DN1945_c0_g1_i1.p1 TRINITY_DN1945_c0_g1~~TRINITY_DN1945_c0_g1_i1.p1  ORF type:complete len:138 (+),score=11.74 TRINITY_DN1945_c0_g1_i1:246-659(+)
MCLAQGSCVTAVGASATYKNKHLRSAVCVTVHFALSRLRAQVSYELFEKLDELKTLAPQQSALRDIEKNTCPVSCAVTLPLRAIAPHVRRVSYELTGTGDVLNPRGTTAWASLLKMRVCNCSWRFCKQCTRKHICSL